MAVRMLIGDARYSLSQLYVMTGALHMRTALGPTAPDTGAVHAGLLYLSSRARCR